jgi:hypothetical protein
MDNSSTVQFPLDCEAIGRTHTGRRSVEELGALEDVLVALRGEHQVVLGDVVPHEAVLVAPAEARGIKPTEEERKCTLLTIN